jgi:cold shock CspA family protein
MYRLQVFDDGQRRYPGKDGYLGRRCVKQFEIILTINPDDREKVYPILVEGPEKHVVPLGLENMGDTQVFRFSVPMDDGLTTYPSNHFRLVVMRRAEFYIVEIGVITQGNKYFLVEQVTWRGVLYRDPTHETIICPTFDRGYERSWPEMSIFLKQHLPQGQRLPHISQYQPPTSPRIIPAKGRAYVCWFNPMSGMGCAHISDGKGGIKAVRIHWSKILLTNGDRFRTVVSGQVVDFQQVKPLQRPSPSFDQQLVGVRLAAA